MPRILQLEKRDGYVWARLDMANFVDQEQPVSLWTANEIKNLEFKIKEDFKLVLAEFLQANLK